MRFFLSLQKFAGRITWNKLDYIINTSFFLLFCLIFDRLFVQWMRLHGAPVVWWKKIKEKESNPRVRYSESSVILFTVGVYLCGFP